MSASHAGTFWGFFLLAILAAPLLVAPALLVPRSAPAALRLAPWAIAPALGLSLWFGTQGLQGPADPSGDLVRGELPWLLLGTRLGVDLVGWPFLLVTSLLWLVSAVYGRAYLARDPARHRFFAFYLAAASGNLGLILAQDVASFYLFFALMGFAAYPLIAHDASPGARRAGQVYIVMLLLGEALLLAALLMAASAASGSLDLRVVAASAARAPERDVILALTLCGFGIKVGVLLLHVWLPLAHSLAPTPASAVLSGAMIKAGLLGWLRFLPLGLAPVPHAEGLPGAMPLPPVWAEAVLVAGVAAAFYGVLVGLTQEHPKAVLAYSSVSQMGLMTAGIGLALAATRRLPEGTNGHAALVAIQLYAIHHALNKGALFLGVGVAPAAGGPRQRRLAALGLLLPALALAGAPLTSGALAKASLKAAVGLAPDPWTEHLDLPLLLATVGTTLLMARFLSLVWPGGGSRDAHATGSGPDAPVGIWTPWLLLVFLASAVSWGVSLWIAPEAVAYTLAAAGLLPALWPVILGGLLAGGIAWSAGRFGRRAAGSGEARRPRPRVPTGDLLILFLWLGERFLVAWRGRFLPAWHLLRTSLAARWDGLKTRGRTGLAPASAEAWLAEWPTVGLVLFLLLLLLLAALLMEALI